VVSKLIARRPFDGVRFAGEEIPCDVGERVISASNVASGLFGWGRNGEDCGVRSIIREGDLLAPTKVSERCLVGGGVCTWREVFFV